MHYCFFRWVWVRRDSEDGSTISESAPPSWTPTSADACGGWAHNHDDEWQAVQVLAPLACKEHAILGFIARNDWKAATIPQVRLLLADAMLTGDVPELLGEVPKSSNFASPEVVPHSKDRTKMYLVDVVINGQYGNAGLEAVWNLVCWMRSSDHFDIQALVHKVVMRQAVAFGRKGRIRFDAALGVHEELQAEKLYPTNQSWRYLDEFNALMRTLPAIATLPRRKLPRHWNPG